MWFAVGPAQLHLIDEPAGAFRREPRINISDVHFAINVTDFEAAMAALQAKGFREDLPDGDPRRLLILRGGPAGFAQAYLLDPDRHIVEINGARTPGA